MSGEAKLPQWMIDAMHDVARELWRDSNGQEYAFRPDTDAGKECLTSAKKYLAIYLKYSPPTRPPSDMSL